MNPFFAISKKKDDCIGARRTLDTKPCQGTVRCTLYCSIQCTLYTVQMCYLFPRFRPGCSPDPPFRCLCKYIYVDSDKFTKVEQKPLLFLLSGLYFCLKTSRIYVINICIPLFIFRVLELCLSVKVLMYVFCYPDNCFSEIYLLN